jgi:hypothetical protein
MARELEGDGVLSRPRGGTTNNFFDLPEEIQYMCPDMLSPKLKSLIQLDGDFESDMSPYIEYTYSAGMLFLMLATLQLEPREDMNPEAVIYKDLPKLSPSLKKVLQLSVLPKSSRRMSLITLNKLL